MRSNNAAFALLALCAWDGTGLAADTNSANDPTTPRLTAQYWNYYATSLKDIDGDAENGVGRLLVPFKIAGVQQILHFDPPVVTNPTATSGPRTGLGNMQIYNFSLTQLDLGLSKPVTFGIGPLLAVPTSTSRNFGPDRLQAGAGGVISAPLSWGMLGVLATYQHTLSGDSVEMTSVQPIAYYNLPDGYYLRSSPIMIFDSTRDMKMIPVGFGIGKVVDLDGGYTLNAYAEAQPTIYAEGEGVPEFQVFTGIQIQLPASFTQEWSF